MIRAPIAIALALVLADGWQHEKGKRIDVYAAYKAEALRTSRAAEDAAARFEELLGSFPGERGAVLVRSGEDDEDPDWRKAGAAWLFTHRSPWSLVVTPDLPDGLPVRTRLGEPDTFGHDLAIRILLEWSDLSAKDPPKGDGSGTRLPDWWEEAVAGWCGKREERDTRRGNMDAALTLGKAIPLDRMLSMVRTQDPGMVSPPGNLPPGLPPEIMEAVKRASKAPVLPAQSLSFLEYLVENEGVEFVRHAADLQARGLGLVNALPWLKEHAKERAKPKTPVPGTIREFEKAWLAWARSRRP